MKKIVTEFDIIYKYNKKMKDKVYSIDRKYSKMLGLRKEKLDARKERELGSYERRMKKAMDREIYNLTHTRQKKEPVDKRIGKLKAKALKCIQRFSKLSKCMIREGKISIFLRDKLQRTELNKNVNAGHCYGQKNFPGLAFDYYNIRPIHCQTNKNQNDQIGERKKNLNIIAQQYLEEKSKDTSIKRKQRDRKFYEDIIAKYTPLIEREEHRLGISQVQ